MIIICEFRQVDRLIFMVKFIDYDHKPTGHVYNEGIGMGTRGAWSHVSVLLMARNVDTLNSLHILLKVLHL